MDVTFVFILREDLSMKNITRRNISLMYVITFFDSLILAYVIERLFNEERGMTVQMVVATEILYSLTIVIFEVPSGIFADKIGRKKTLLISGLLSVMELILVSQAHHFCTFALATFLAGISHAASSGCFQAMVYDSLAVNGEQETFERNFSRIKVVDTIGSSIAALTGGVIAYYFSYEMTYYISIVSKLFACFLTNFLLEPPRKRLILDKKNKNENTFLTYCKVGIVFLSNEKVIVYYSMIGLLLGSCETYLEEFWQLIMKEIRIPVILFGLIFISFSICSIPGNLLVPYVKTRCSNQLFFIIIPIIYGVSFICISFLRNLWVLIPMCMIGLLKGMMEPIVEGIIHHNTESSVRATVESCISLYARLLSIILGLLFSVFAYQDIFLGFLVLGIICLLGIMVSFLSSFIKRMSVEESS